MVDTSESSQTRRTTDRPLGVRFGECGIVVLESHHSETFTMEWTVHDFFKVLAITHGHGTLRTRTHDLPFSEGDLIAVPPKTEHRIVDEPRRNVSLFAVAIEIDKQVDAVAQFIRSATEVFRRRVSGAGRQLQRQLRSILYEQSRRALGWEMIITGEVYELLTWMIRNSVDTTTVSAAADSESRVHAYIEELTSTFFQQQTLSEAAQSVGLSERRFSQLFRQLTGRSWLQHLTYLRIRHSLQLLSQTDHSVTAVAFQCGFDDLSTFYRAFRAAQGVSPGIWRVRAESSQPGESYSAAAPK